MSDHEELLTQVDYLVDACESDPANAAERSDPAALYELVAGLAEVVRQRRDEEVGYSVLPGIWAQQVVDAGLAEFTAGAPNLDHPQRVRWLIPDEASARVSEAETQIPEPLLRGQVIYVEHPVVGDFTHVTVSVPRRALIEAPRIELELKDGAEVAILPADLAEKAAALDREGTERELAELRRRIDLLKEGFDTDDPVRLGEAFDSQARKWLAAERELEAMTAVARRFRDGWALDLVKGEWWRAIGGLAKQVQSEPISDAERQALKTLGVGDDE